MPSEKRSHGRITSGSSRPHKSARFGHDSSDDDNLANGDSDDEMLMDEPPYVTTSATYQSLNSNLFRQRPTMRVNQVVAWPTSLAAIKNGFAYNSTPQKGSQLPFHVLQLVSNRILRPSSRDGADMFSPTPYIHLGYTIFLNLQIFVFLPNLRIANCYEQNPGRIYDFRLERWTESVFLPSVADYCSAIPSSWRHDNHNWHDEDDDFCPIYQLHNDSGNQLFHRIWRRIQELSMKTPEFQHPFLLLYSDGRGPQVFHSSQPEESMHEFEVQWHDNIDMTYLVSPEENLKVDFDYSGSGQTRDLPMR